MNIFISTPIRNVCWHVAVRKVDLQRSWRSKLSVAVKLYCSMRYIFSIEYESKRLKVLKDADNINSREPLVRAGLFSKILSFRYEL